MNINSGLFAEQRMCVLGWTSGDKLGCPSFQVNTIRVLKDSFVDVKVGPETLRLVYVESAPGSKLRRFVVSWYIFDRGFGTLGILADSAIAVFRDVADLLRDCMRLELATAKPGIRVRQ